MTSRVKHNSNPPLRLPLDQCLGCLEGYLTFSTHKLGADIFSGPIAITFRWSILIGAPPPPSEACYGLAPHKQELCYATVSAAMALFDTIITSTEYLSKSILRFFMSCTFLQSSGRWPQRENAHLFSPPLLLNNVLAVWCPFLRSFDPPRCAVKL